MTATCMPITATRVTRHGWLHHALNGEAMNLSQIFPPSVSGDSGGGSCPSVSVGPNPWITGRFAPFDRTDLN